MNTQQKLFLSIFGKYITPSTKRWQVQLYTCCFAALCLFVGGEMINLTVFSLFNLFTIPPLTWYAILEISTYNAINFVVLGTLYMYLKFIKNIEINGNSIIINRNRKWFFNK